MKFAVAIIFTCYNCNKDFPNDQMKSVSHCRLVTYCSNDFQEISWKATHKQSYKIHPSLASSTNPDQLASKELKKFTLEWTEFEVDRALSRLLRLWHTVFYIWGTMCLDLTNHPLERVTTHLTNMSHF